MLTREQVLSALRTRGGVPFAGKQRGRNIYETDGGGYCIDYASFPGGTADECPRTLIDELEKEGLIVRAYPHAPTVNTWALREHVEGSR